MGAGLRRLGGGVGPEFGSEPGTYGDSGDPVGPPLRDGDAIEVVTEDAVAVIEVAEAVAVGSDVASGIDLSDPLYSPIGVPIALQRGPDGIVRANASAIADRPTRDEMTAAISSVRLGHRHVQEVPSEQWLIYHDLTYVPAGVEIEGVAGQRLYPRRIHHPALGRTRIEFTRPVAGSVDLS